MAVQEYLTNVDIGARACQFCGDYRLFSFQDPSPQAREIAFAYDKLRLAELQRIVWRFATKRAVLRPINSTTMQLMPAVWVSTIPYGLGSVVSYNGLLWVSIGWPTVGATPDATPLWVPYFGPLTADVWGSSSVNPATVGYFAGELVYYPATEAYSVYVSLQNGNTDTPGVTPTWDSTIIYNRGDVVMTGEIALLSEPGDIPVTSTGGIPVFSSATGPWQSQKDLNLNVTPGSDPSSWVLLSSTQQTQFRTGETQKWLKLDATLQGMNLIYPIGVGPATDVNTRNLYKLPSGFLKHAPDQDNPNTNVRVMGVVSQAPTDAQFENGYMVTSQVAVVMMRFVADMTDVTQMDDLFCEALAARIARDVHPVITPKEEHMKVLARTQRAYKEAIGDARANDAIERDASAQPQSQYVSIRF